MSRVQPHHYRSVTARARGGFSFVEVMFAVVILGIGFIMVAAIFPVAISQNQVTGEQASSSAFARVSASVMQQLCVYNSAVAGYNFSPSQGTAVGVNNPTYVFPVDSNAVATAGVPTPFPHGSFYAAAGGQISSSDPRFAAVPLYSLSASGAVTQFYFFNVTVRNQPVYTTADVAPYLTLPNSNPISNPNPIPAPNPAFLQSTLTPKLLQAVITAASVPSLITFADGTVSTDNPYKQVGWTGVALAARCYYTPNATQAVGTGCYVLIGSDNAAAVDGSSTTVPNSAGLFNGKVYKVGNQRLDLNSAGNTYEMAPGDEFTPQAFGGTTIAGIGKSNFSTYADVWIVGKGLQNHSSPFVAGANTYTDNVQDVSFYTTYAPLH